MRGMIKRTLNCSSLSVEVLLKKMSLPTFTLSACLIALHLQPLFSGRILGLLCLLLPFLWLSISISYLPSQLSHGTITKEL